MEVGTLRIRLLTVLAALPVAFAACSRPADPSTQAGALHLDGILQLPDGSPAPGTRRTLGGIGRPAVAARGPEPLSARVLVPRGGSLRFAVAAPGDEPVGCEVTLRAGRSQAESLWRGEVRRRDGWIPGRVDLARYAGRTVTLDFIAQAGDSILWGSPVIAGSEARSDRRDVVLYELDTLRADLLGTYGYPGGSTPALDALARAGATFVSCHATATWTRPSATSILTSLSAPAHDVVWDSGSLAPEIVTLAQVLRERGWYTVAFQPNPNAGRPVGLDRGFDEVIEMSALIRIAQQASDRFQGNRMLSGTTASGTTELIAFALHDHVGDWAGLPLFLYVHPTDPHTPYDPRAPFSGLPVAGRGRPDDEEYVAYARDVRAADHFLERILRTLESERGLERTVVSFLSDHGEEFGERGGRGHGRNLHEETLRVPFLLRAPDLPAAGRLVPGRVSTLDLAPTLLDLVEGPALEGAEGRSLVPELSDPSAPGTAPDRSDFAHVISIVARMHEAQRRTPDNIGQIAVIEGRWKCVVQDRGKRRRPRPKLYDLVADPGETSDVAEQHPEIAARLDAEAWAWYEDRRSGGHARVEETVVDPELQEQLRALGYAD